MRHVLIVLFLVGIVYAENIKSLHNKCINNDENACYSLGKKIDSGDIPLNIIKLFKKGCMKGQGRDCNFMGEIYQNERYVDFDMDKAIYYYKKSCRKNDPIGCNNLGLAYKYYKHLNPTDYIYYFKKSCNMKNSAGAVGCMNLASMYKWGREVKEDLNKMVYFYKKACNMGNTYINGMGCKELANLYEIGLGVNKDFNKAIELYKKSCNMKYANACYILGNKYKFGDNVKKSKKLAKKYYDKAYLLGYERFWHCKLYKNGILQKGYLRIEASKKIEAEKKALESYKERGEKIDRVECN